MKLRLASADTLIDIGRLAELKGVRADGRRRLRDRRADDVRRGRSTSTPLGFAAGLPARASATSRSATAARSAARSPTADPASDAAGARARARLLGRRSARRAASGSSRSTGSSRARSRPAMEPDEILVALRRGPLPAGAGGAYRKLEQPASGYSIVGVAAVVVASSGGADLATPASR